MRPLRTARERPPAASDATWAAPTARARLAAVALAVACAVLTMVVVDRTWHRPAPVARRVAPPPAAPVGVMLIPAPSSERASSAATPRTAR